MSVTILMDPGKMRKTAGSLMDAAAKTRGSANALGALSSPPPGVPASVAGRVTGATNRAKGALERQAALIESLANDMKTRAAFAVAADTGGQIAGTLNKVVGLAAGVEQAGRLYEARQNTASKLRRAGWAPNKIRDEVDRRMAKQYGVMGLSATRQRQLQQNGRLLKGPDGRDLPSRTTNTLRASLSAQFGGRGGGGIPDIDGHLKKVSGPLAIAGTLLTHGSTVANPYLTRSQKTEQIADDTASAAVGAAPAIAAGFAFGGPVGAGVAAATVVGDIATGGKVTEVSDNIGETAVEVGKDFGKGVVKVGSGVVNAYTALGKPAAATAERLPEVLPWTTIGRPAVETAKLVNKYKPWDGVAPW